MTKESIILENDEFLLTSKYIDVKIKSSRREFYGRMILTNRKVILLLKEKLFRRETQRIYFYSNIINVERKGLIRKRLYIFIKKPDDTDITKIIVLRQDQIKDVILALEKVIKKVYI